ncbi:hypothetical protein [Bradyrhizobium sp.]|uniref:hypothetical protein n=1 Tax=Bradyrhizobium sp. TaxID=376 RepID=UPI002608B8C6|nr:hypothetical protein [Bradyrhizobium sp.]
MSDDRESERIKPAKQESAPRCPACAAFSHLAAKLLDTQNGKTVRLYQCQCGERIWDD